MRLYIHGMRKQDGYVYRIFNGMSGQYYTPPLTEEEILRVLLIHHSMRSLNDWFSSNVNSLFNALKIAREETSRHREMTGLVARWYQARSDYPQKGSSAKTKKAYLESLSETLDKPLGQIIKESLVYYGKIGMVQDIERDPTYPQKLDRLIGLLDK